MFQGLIDTTLRDGQQSPLLFDSGKMAFTLSDKKSLIRGLVKLGVAKLEVFSPIVNDTEAKHLPSLVKYTKSLSAGKTKILAHVRAHPTDIDAAIKAGVDGLNLFIGLSGNARKYSHGKPLRQLLTEISLLLKTLRQEYPGLYLRFSAEDAFRTKLNNIFHIYDHLSPYVDTFGVPDTVGIASPKTTAQTVSRFKKRYPLKHLECHFHNDRGLSMANAITAVETGANYIDTSIWGLAERSGITSTTGLLLNLHFLDNSLTQPYDLGLCYSLNVLMGTILGLQVPYSEPVSLTNRTHIAGVHQKAVLRHPEVYEASQLIKFGVTKNQFLLGPLSGWNLIYYYLKEVEAYQLTHQQAKDITSQFKLQSAHLNGETHPHHLLQHLVKTVGLQKSPPKTSHFHRLENLSNGEVL